MKSILPHGVACLKEPGIGVDVFGAIVLPTNVKWLTNPPEVTQLVNGRARILMLL